MDTLFLAFWCVIIISPSLIRAQNQVTISMKPAPLPDTVAFPSWHHLTFDKDPSNPGNFPASWSGIALCPLMNDAAFFEVDIARFKDANGTWRYAVDADADRVFDDNSILSFQPAGGHEAATVQLTVKRRSGGQELPKLTYQINSDSLGLSARIGECREGTFSINGKAFPVRLVLTSVNTPYFSADKGTFAMIDVNHDGSYCPNWKVNAAGTIDISERITWGKPFLLDGKKFLVASIDPTGTNIVCQEFLGDAALATGFEAPSWSATAMDGSKISSSSLPGDVVLLFFWSPTCHFCEGIRPQLDEMVARHAGKRFRLMSFTTEQNIQTLKTFLTKTPYAGTIVPYNPSPWSAFNSKMQTPVFCLIDKDGTVKLYGAGASFFTVIDKMTDEMLAGK